MRSTRPLSRSTSSSPAGWRSQLVQLSVWRPIVTRRPCAPSPAKRTAYSPIWSQVKSRTTVDDVGPRWRIESSKRNGLGLVVVVHGAS